MPFCSAAACPEYLNGLKHLNSWLVFCIRSYYYWQQFLEPQGQGSVLPNAGCRTKSYGMGTVKNKAWGQRLGFGGAGAAAARLLPGHPQPCFASWRQSHPLHPRMGFPFPPRCSLSQHPCASPLTCLLQLPPETGLPEHWRQHLPSWQVNEMIEVRLMPQTDLNIATMDVNFICI